MGLRSFGAQAFTNRRPKLFVKCHLERQITSIKKVMISIHSDMSLIFIDFLNNLQFNSLTPSLLKKYCSMMKSVLSGKSNKDERIPKFLETLSAVFYNMLITYHLLKSRCNMMHYVIVFYYMWSMFVPNYPI